MRKSYLSSMTKSGLNTLASRIVSLSMTERYFKILSFWPIWKYGRNYQAVRSYRASPPFLDNVQQRIVNDLKKTGIAICHIDELFSGGGGGKIFGHLEYHIQKTMQKYSLVPKGGKPFLGYLWDKIPFVDMENPFFELALNERIIAMVNGYMEMYSRFYYATLNVTHPVGEGEKKVASQRWHRDPEDKRLVKMFIYMTDVDENAGPFTYVPFSTYGKKYGHLFPQRAPSGSYPAPHDFEKAISRNDICVCTGRKGTIIFCDTSGLHCGGYARSRERIMFTAGWRSCASVMRTWVNFPPHLPETLMRMGQGHAIQFAAKPNTHTRLTGFMSRRFYELTKSEDMMIG